MMLLAASAWLPAASELRLFAPEFALVGTIVAVLLVAMVVGRSARVAALVTLAGAITTLLATLWMAGDVAGGGRGGFSPPGLPPLLIADNFTVFFRMFLITFVVLITWLWLVGARPKAAAHAAASLGSTGVMGGGSPEFFVLLLTSALGMLVMVGTLNLLVMVVAIETASLPSYALVASDRRSRLGAEAALKYVVFGAASTAIMIFGISLLYGRFATLDVSVMAARLAADVTPDALLWLGLLGVGAGLAFKIAAVPMHLWCPDVFEGAPIEVTTWLSVASKAAAIGLLLRLMGAFAAQPALAEVIGPMTWAVGLVAAITCTAGNLAALRQNSVKRILAYSSIAHAGYMLMAAALLTGGPQDAHTHAGLAAVVAYLLVYLVMNLCAFGAAAMVVWQTGSDQLEAFTGLGRRAPLVAFALAVCLFSLVGLPPLGGFAAKWYLLIAIGKAAFVQPWLWTLVIVATINTALSLYFYVRIVRQMYLVDDPSQPAFKAPVAGVVLVNACAVVLLLLGTVWFNPLGQRAATVATNLFTTSSTASIAQANPAHPPGH